MSTLFCCIARYVLTGVSDSPSSCRNGGEYGLAISNLPNAIRFQVDWYKEKECFETLLRELAFFYLPAPMWRHAATNSEEQQWQIQNILFPAFKQYLTAPLILAEKECITQIASLEKLYRVFERC